VEELLVRFIVGGIVVSAFALLGSCLKPRSFAGLFGAAPSVALATIGLTVTTQGKAYAATEARSMIVGAVAFFVVAAAGALWRAKPSRAIRWARSNPWRFAVLPALACAAVALVLSVVTGGGIIDPVLSGLWHGGITFGLVGAAGVLSKSKKQQGA